ncbi:hypothetical protein E8E12_004446 [Didymella heteroderae]|uniref:Uncharacterized protein n=1 Tax=Didymella heteroderae TaxID=1769908 RepID=A0A9P4WJS9_9PLEO|nr:hypothetical protein E8E12_004446 [Didymella heteroderae]
MTTILNADMAYCYNHYTSPAQPVSGIQSPEYAHEVPTSKDAPQALSPPPYYSSPLPVPGRMAMLVVEASRPVTTTTTARQGHRTYCGTGAFKTIAIFFFLASVVLGSAVIFFSYT